jgi:hypothetical protein
MQCILGDPEFQENELRLPRETNERVELSQGGRGFFSLDSAISRGFLLGRRAVDTAIADAITSHDPQVWPGDEQVK